MKLLKSLLLSLLIASLLVSPLEAKTPWSSKPPLGQQIDWGHPLSRGLVGCWLMEDVSGGGHPKTQDLTGRTPLILSNGGGTNGGPILVPTQKGIGYRFVNSATVTNIRVLYQTSEYLNMGLDSISIAGMFKTNSAITNGGIVGKSRAANARLRYSVLFESGIYMFFDGTTAVNTSKVSGYNDGKFHSFVAVWDRKGNESLYIDGQLKVSADISAQNASDITSTNQFFIGAYQNSIGNDTLASYGFDGDIIYTYFWRRALSPSEIQQLYQDPYCFIKPQTDWNCIKAAVAGGINDVFGWMDGTATQDIFGGVI